MKRPSSPFWAFFLLSGISAVGMAQNASVTSGQYETSPLFRSADFLPAEYLIGTAHRVRETVPTDGYMTHFTIDSDYGVFSAIGVEQAVIRIKEIYAIKKLVGVSKSDLFARGLKRSVQQPVTAVKNIAQNPVDSVKAVPKTVSHLFKKVGQSVGNAAKKIKSQPGKQKKSTTETVKEVGSGIGNATKGVLGFHSAKLECAKQLQVDPYSDNKRLQEEIEKVSWVFFSGGLPLQIGAMAVSGGASAALAATNLVGLPGEVYSLTPSQLNLQNSKDLEAMGVSKDLIQAFLSNPHSSISLQRSIVLSLTALGRIPGRNKVIETAVKLQQRRQVNFLDNALKLLVLRQTAGLERYKELKSFGLLIGAVSSKGMLHLPVPTDYISWTEQVATFARRDDFKGTQPVLLMKGRISEAAQREFTNLGWLLVSAKI